MDKKNLLKKDFYGDNFGENIIQKMIFATKHRGLNTQNENNFLVKTFEENLDFSSFSLYFGHNLLPISDFSPLAKQPFCVGENVLVFNGQIYNHQTLRKNIKFKPNFLQDFSDFPKYQTHSDTETLAYFFHQISEFSPQKILSNIELLNGMFACVYYDNLHKQLIICRDKNAIKPLFYFENDDFLIIASEIRAILASGLVAKKINISQIPHYLTFKYAESPNTFFENIFEIKENFVLNLKDYLTKKEKINAYHVPTSFSLLPPNVPTSFSLLPPHNRPKSIVTDLDEILRNSIKNQLVADRPIGVFASGGVDSTLLLAYCQELGYKTTAYSAINSAEERHFGTNDYYFSEKSALQYGANYCPFVLNSNILNDLTPYINACDQPIADGAGLLTYHLAREASKMHQVLFSGAGADEIFAGYNRHKAFYLYEKYHLKYFFWLKDITKFAFNNVLNPAIFGDFFRKKIRLLDKVFGNIFWEKIPTFLGFTRLSIPLKEDFFRIFLNEKKETIFSLFSNFSLKDALYYDKTHFLQQDILAITDQMTMQHTTEMRVPYLDNDIENYISQFPAEFLLKNGKKWLLKEILNKKNGKIYTIRPKEGFGMPLGKWLFLPQNAHYIDFLRNLPTILYEFLDKKQFEQNLHLHKKNKIDYSAEMWAVLILGLRFKV